MREYFEAEMRLLRQLEEEYAKNFPEKARLLRLQSLPNKDPYIERLLEGTAYLTAQIRQRIDDDLPDICETLLEQLWPQMLRSFPSATIMQFSAKPGQLHNTYLLPKGVEIQSKPVGEGINKTPCRFRTTEAVKINPITIKEILLEERNEKIVVKITLQTHSGVGLSHLDLSEIPLYLHGEASIALFWYWVLTHEVKKTTISISENSKSTIKNLNELISISRRQFSEETVLLPTSEKCFFGFHLLHEFFCFREKLLFVNLTGINTKLLPNSCGQLTIEIETKVPFTNTTHFPKDLLRLHCVPAVNLFEKSCEPIQLTHKKIEYPVIADVNSPYTFVYSINHVTGINNAGVQYDYFPMSLHREEMNNYYHIHWRILDAIYPQAFLSVQQNIFRKEVLSCQITATQGHMPQMYLQENWLKIPTASFPMFIEFQNITRPSAMYFSSHRAVYRWNLIAHLSLNYLSLQDLTTLRKLLQQYDWTHRSENDRRIHGISNLHVRPIKQVYKGILLQGLEFNLTFAEENYLNFADIYHFAEVLHQFFSMYAPVNTLVVTKAELLPSLQEFSWNTFSENRFPV